MTRVVPLPSNELLRRPAAERWLDERVRKQGIEGSVLFHAPSHVFQAPGGGENQLVQTRKALEALSVPVRLFNPWTDRLEDARVLHLFGMSHEGLALARVARARRVPVVLSPICWYEPRALWSLASSHAAGFRDLAKWTVQRTLPRWPRWRRELLSLADAILPNSHAEAQQLARLFALERGRIHPVPNGVDARFAGATPAEWVSAHGAAPFVLFVGRVEPRKNVLGLIQTCRKLKLPLVVIGDAPPGCESYRAACQAEGGEIVRWLGALDHEGALLASAYAAARVLALPSWFETPGLVALEAALAGTAVIVTPFGCAREYFGDRVAYARPDRARELARTLEHVWHAGPDPSLASHVRSCFLWSEVAQQVAGVYDQLTV